MAVVGSRVPSSPASFEIFLDGASGECSPRFNPSDVKIVYLDDDVGASAAVVQNAPAADSASLQVLATGQPEATYEVVLSPLNDFLVDNDLLPDIRIG